MTTGCFVVGAAETARLGRIPDQSVLELNVEAGLRALTDAGLRTTDIDGIAGAYSPHQVAHALGVQPRWVDTTNVGGCSFMAHVRHASAALRAGYADAVLITHGESNRSRVGVPPRPRDPASLTGQFEEPYGARAPYTKFTLPALRYMHEHGLTERDLAEVVVAQRHWAHRNSRAGRRTRMTVEEVLAAPVLAWPFRIPQVCMVTDGGGALVLIRAGDARVGQRARAVEVLGTGEATESPMVAYLPNAGVSGAARRAAADAFAEADLRHGDIDHVMNYDAFAHLPWIGLESMGFFGPGAAARFISEGGTAPGGPLPLNTNGGGLAYTHTGMYGMFALTESARQVRGEADADIGPVGTSLALGFGGMFTAAGVTILGRPR
ncbi:thiolase C-terminal domain-containing protein [Nocardia callitridis]|uniref:Thiolase n=1 Tax=Nocardia callitridis TaxID=648753 RepID=A0ABP9KQZ1_9NOCA